MYVVANEPKMPAILEAAQVSDYSSFAAFRNDIKGRYLSYDSDTVKYEALDGSMIEVNFGILYDGNNIEVNDQKQASELESYPTFESPYVNSEWDSGYIVISKDGNKCTLDFRDSDNPKKTVEVLTDETLPVISVSPSTVEVPEANVNFLVDLIVTNAVDIQAWNMTVTWDPEILQLNSVTEGDFLSSVGSTDFRAIDSYLLQNSNSVDSGLLQDFSNALFFAPGASGDGVLATLNFTSLRPGNCVLMLEDTLLNGFTGEPLIEHDLNDAEVIVIPEFQTWMFVPIFLIVAVSVVLIRKVFKL